MIKSIWTYLLSVSKHLIWIISGVISVISIFIIQNYYPEYNIIYSILLFRVGLLSAQFLARKELNDIIEKGYNLPPRAVTILQELYDQPEQRITYTDMNKQERNVLFELAEEKYVEFFPHPNGGFLLLNIKGIKYIEKRLPLN